MKIKKDFITNSSSASFLMCIKTDENITTLEEFEKWFSNYMDIYIDNLKEYCHSSSFPSFYNPGNIRQESGNLFVIIDSCLLYNNYKNVPQYMRDLILRHLIDNDLKGIKNITIKVEKDE